MRRWPAWVVAALVFAGAPANAAAVATPRPAGEVVWVRFVDHGAAERASDEGRRSMARAALSPRSLERRARRAGRSGPLLQANDLPVEPRYLVELAERGFRVRVASRWLNAASVVATPEQIDELRALPFVRAVEPVALGRRGAPDTELAPATPVGAPEAGRRAAETAAPGDPSFYGYSAAQIRLVQVDRLHALGLSGKGVLIAMLDTGFRETHTVFDSLAVVARRDFVNADTVVANEPTQDGFSQDTHGTQTLSIVSANLPGTMVGPAYHAQFALAKTEDLAIEEPVEMDWWQAAAEWADSLGADVISSSLGYTTFQPPTGFYSYADMDGRTTLITRAAAEAARRGIVVVTAEGNEGSLSWHYLVAPADAESACAVGATDSLGAVAPYSGYGPSADGRVKPDVCAMGTSAALVSPGNDFVIGHGSGTSFSTPMIAGLSALLLEAHPAWTPFDVIQALRATATRFATPDAHFGFGLAQGEAALAWTPSTVFANPAPGQPAIVLVGPTPSRRGGALAFWVRGGVTEGPASVTVFDARGRRLRSLFDGHLTAGGERLLSWDGKDGAGVLSPAGLYFIQLEAPDVHLGRRVVLL